MLERIFPLSISKVVKRLSDCLIAGRLDFTNLIYRAKSIRFYKKLLVIYLATYSFCKKALGIGSHSRKSLLQRLQGGLGSAGGHHYSSCQDGLFVFESNQKDSTKTGHTFEREKD